MAKCIGCGIKLQTNSEELPGYVPKLISIESTDNIYCQRCFQIIHNGKKYKPLISHTDYYHKISILKNKKALIVLMIDIMDIYGGFIPYLADYIGNNPVIVVVNKVDIMPKDVRLKKIDERIREIASNESLNVLSVIMISAIKKQNLDKVLLKILKIKENHDKKQFGYKNKRQNKLSECYILGCASVGKSTFINAIKQIYLNDDTKITTSDQFQTTMEFIKVFVDKDNYIIDTPGLINKRSFGAYLDYESVKKLTPKSYLKPRTFQLKPDQTIFMGGLVKLDFLSGIKINVSFYTSNELYLHRTKTINAEGIFTTQLGKLLVPPISKEEMEKIKDTKTHLFEIKEGAFDLLISGVGFVHIVGENISIKVTLFEEINVLLVPSFI